MRKAGSDEFFIRLQSNPERSQHRLPASAVVSDNRLDIVLINGRVLLTDSIDIRMFFHGDADAPLVIQRDLGIGNDGGRKKGMGHPALRTADPAYPQPYRPAVLLDIALIVAMNTETGRMTTGPGETV